MGLSTYALGVFFSLVSAVSFLSPSGLSSSSVLLLSLYVLFSPMVSPLSLARIWPALPPMVLSSRALGGSQCIFLGVSSLSTSEFSSSTVLLLCLSFLVATMFPI